MARMTEGMSVWTPGMRGSNRMGHRRISRLSDGRRFQDYDEDEDDVEEDAEEDEEDDAESTRWCAGACQDARPDPG